MKRKSSAASSRLAEGVVSLLGEVFIAGVEGVVFEKVTRALVGVALFVLVRGILVIKLTELFRLEIILNEFWPKASSVSVGCIYTREFLHSRLI